MKPEELINKIAHGQLDKTLTDLYGEDALDRQRFRYTDAIREFSNLYGHDRDVSLFSVPGRSELSGNHTDHNRGKVIACSVNLDIIAVAAAREDSVIRLKSAGFPEDVVDLASYIAPDESDFGHSTSLIAGVAAGMKMRGYSVGGFDAYTISSVLKGSGLSSSAAFENMVGTILSHIYNEGSVDYVSVSQISQYAENAFFGKPCGLMDQMACAAGGTITIDFEDKENPRAEKLDFDFNRAGYRLCIVNTGGNHADLTADYASVPAEMKEAAGLCGKEVLREVDEEKFLEALPSLREKCGDRAILRALHFFEENRRVTSQAEALKNGNLDAYFRGVLESGRSSCFYLQNVYSTVNVREQGLTLALCLCEKFLKRVARPSAFRLQGGGFAGTIQAYVPEENVDEFVKYMGSFFGESSVFVLRIRPAGAVRVL